ncbi:MAG: amidohydrolase family protein [Anaerolineae bacterium]|nr:amidohydrolase family protein [Anaerolineae bacterium]
MLHKPSPVFDRISERVAALPVIDCHEHMAGPAFMPVVHEPIAALILGYLSSDLISAYTDPDTLLMLQDPEGDTEKKWPVFEAIWKRTEHTAYARVTRLVLRDVYGEAAMSLAALRRVGEQLAARDAAFYVRMLDEANIHLILSDVLHWQPDDLRQFLRGEKTFPDRVRVMIQLPFFHVVKEHDISARDWEGVQLIGRCADRHITSLDEYLQAVYEVMAQAKARGAVGVRTRARMSGRCTMMSRPGPMRSGSSTACWPTRAPSSGWPDAKPLDDFLFHQYMRFARELDLPVQLHTGHMAGIYNRVDKANAAHLTTVLELHQQVRFDLFHGNWPYMDDLLFLIKNYPNAALDCCWLPIIDPLYAEEMLERAVVTVPHVKVHGFGGDYVDAPEYSAAHLKIARHVIASALADLAERGWLDEDAALSIAADWLFNNPNQFFRLGCEPITP